MAGERESQQQLASCTVEELVAVNPYNPDILSDLENYVDEQSENRRLPDFASSGTKLQKNRSILEVVPGFDQAIQNFAIHDLSLTYQKVPRPVLAEAINIVGLSLDKFLEWLGSQLWLSLSAGSSPSERVQPP